MAISYSEFAKKKVLGVPVLYLSAGFVVVLAIVAWRLKPSADTNTDGTNPTDSTAGADGTGQTAGQLAGTTDPYGGFDTGGTVVVQPTPSESATPAAPTNETWLNQAIPFVASALKMSSGTVQVGLNKYLNGSDLSYDEAQMRDAAIDKFGPPPEGTSGFGQVGSQPAQKQFSTFPGKHVVKGPNDNTPMKLAGLYYGTADWTHANFIAAHNVALGPPATTYTTGTTVVISAYTQPKYYTVPKGITTFTQVAAKNGTTKEVLQWLNPTFTEPFPAGMKIRVA